MLHSGDPEGTRRMDTKEMGEGQNHAWPLHHVPPQQNHVQPRQEPQNHTPPQPVYEDISSDEDNAEVIDEDMDEEEEIDVCNVDSEEEGSDGESDESDVDGNEMGDVESDGRMEGRSEHLSNFKRDVSDNLSHADNNKGDVSINYERTKIPQAEQFIKHEVEHNHKQKYHTVSQYPIHRPHPYHPHRPHTGYPFKTDSRNESTASQHSPLPLIDMTKVLDPTKRIEIPTPKKEIPTSTLPPLHLQDPYQRLYQPIPPQPDLLKTNNPHLLSQTKAVNLDLSQHISGSNVYPNGPGLAYMYQQQMLHGLKGLNGLNGYNGYNVYNGYIPFNPNSVYNGTSPYARSSSFDLNRSASGSSQGTTSPLDLSPHRTNQTHVPGNHSRVPGNNGNMPGNRSRVPGNGLVAQTRTLDLSTPRSTHPRVPGNIYMPGNGHGHVTQAQTHLRKRRRGSRRSRDPTKPPPMRKYKCDVCAKEFSRSNTLLTHKRIHTGEKPHVCPICNRCFRQPGNLTRHQLVHTDIKPFSCRVCHKNFNRTSNLRTHLGTHTDARTCLCPVCRREFSDLDEVFDHIMDETCDAPSGGGIGGGVGGGVEGMMRMVHPRRM